MNIPLIVLATHDGYFHEDEVVGMAILTTIFKNHVIVRTRNQVDLDNADIVLDVGGIYDHTLRRYDHHMVNSPKNEHNHNYTTAGLIWKHYAESYLTTINIPKTINVNGLTINLRQEVKLAILNKWITPIELIDNGEISGPTVISELVHSMKPYKNEKTRNICDEQFEKTVTIISSLLYRVCHHLVDLITSKVEFTTSEQILSNNNKILYCNTPITNISQFYNTTVCFVIYPVKEYIDENIQTYTINPINISAKRNFKVNIDPRLLGSNESTIKTITGIDGITYIHHTGFKISTNSKESAIALCEYLINSDNQN